MFKWDQRLDSFGMGVFLSFKSLWMVTYFVRLGLGILDAVSKVTTVSFVFIFGLLDSFIVYFWDGFVFRQNLNLNYAQEQLLKRIHSQFRALELRKGTVKGRIKWVGNKEQIRGRMGRVQTGCGWFGLGQKRVETSRGRWGGVGLVGCRRRYTAEYLCLNQQQQYNLVKRLLMVSLRKALLLLLLVVLLHSQSAQVNVSTYNIGNQSYQYIYGSGEATARNGAARSENQATTYVADSTYTPPATGPTPAVISCPINQVYDNILCECVCIFGYYFVGSTCVPQQNQVPSCGRNQVYQNNRCVCAKGYFLIGQVCDVCPPYSTYNLDTTSCICAKGYNLVNGQCLLPYTPEIPPVIPKIECKINEHLVNQICQCLPGFYLIKGVCTYCAAPNYYDPQFAICRPSCKKNELLDLSSNTCVCIGGYYNIQGTCGVCPAFSIYSKTVSNCVCITGYTFNSGYCIPTANPPQKPVPLPVPASPCSDPNAYYQFPKCVCKTNYHLIGGVCLMCPENQVFNPDLSICHIPCNINQSFNIVKNQCDCAPTYFRINGICTQCPGNSTYDAQSESCICPPGYQQSNNGVCIIGCGVNAVLNNGQCCCITNYYPVNGICGQCAWNEVYDQGLGICRIPCDNKRIFDLSTLSCVCLPQYNLLSDGSCDTCPIYSTYDPVTKTCVCHPGYLKNLGLCTPACNAYETYTNGKCLCKTGYYLIGYSCGICPPLTTYDATYRICHSPCKINEVWDPTIRSCRCLPGYYLINGLCGICDSKTQAYNAKTQCCDCIEGYKKSNGQGCNGVCSPICAPNEDFILNRCVCKPGFYLVNNFCVQCPQGQFYDIYQRICRVQCGTNQVYNYNSNKCECAKGFYIVQGICSKCPTGFTYQEYTMTCLIAPCPGINEYYSNITQTCVCQPQYVRINGVCTNCNPGYYFDSYSGKCLCKPGFVEKGGFCNPICPPDQTYVNSKCTCNNGNPLIHGKCDPLNICPPYSHYDFSSRCCVCNDGYSIIGGKCSNYQYCGLNSQLRYGQCYCNQGYFWIQGSCKSCGTNMGFNGVSCECYLGYSPDNNGNCVLSNFQPNCYQNQRYDQSLKACVCVAGTQYIRGKCIIVPTCGDNSYYDSVSCQCNSGYKKQNDKCVVITDIVIPSCPTNAYFNGVSCTCNTGFYQQGLNSCATCPSGLSWNGQTCASGTPNNCLTGYFYNTNSKQCEPSAPSCGDNAYFNGASCVCLTGYNLINGKCMICPKDTVFDGSQCASTAIADNTCGTNKILISGKCVCNSGLYLINNNCLPCPAYTKWNGKYCQCGCDTSAWCLGSPFSVYNTTTNTCQCQTGYINLNGICTASSSP